MSSSCEIMIALKSRDGDVVYIKEAEALQSLFIQQKIKLNQAGPACPPIDLEMITTATLKKVVDYCSRHAEFASDTAALNSFAAQFVRDDDGKMTLFHLIHAAYYLKIYSLMDLTCKTLSHTIKGKGKNIAKFMRLSKNLRDNED